jgi:hypothetical protein
MDLLLHYTVWIGCVQHDCDSSGDRDTLMNTLSAAGCPFAAILTQA